MAEQQPPPLVKLICGMISADPARFDEAAEAMGKHCGPVDLTSDVMAFDFTHYYDAEMGAPLWRRFVSFAAPVRPDVLAEVKQATNALEREFAARPGAPVARPINLDPGYVADPKLVLASMKNFAHRIYLSGGVYGELTLQYRDGAWQAMPWTFPDYASPRYHAFFSAVRQRLREQLRQENQS